MFVSYKVFFVFSAFVVAAFGSPTRIVGGTDAATGSAPWAASIQTGLFTHTHVGGGTIISTRHVLTAASSVNNLITGTIVIANVNIRVGSNYLTSGGSRYSVYRGYRHPDFHPATGFANLAILETLFSMSFSNTVYSAPLQTSVPSFDTDATVAGWGALSVGGLNSERLQTLSTNTITYSDCTSKAQEAAQAQNINVPAIYEQREICTSNADGTGNCNGDLGNGLINPQGFVIGTLSWAFPCGAGGPEVFTRTDFYIQWILSVVN